MQWAGPTFAFAALKQLQALFTAACRASHAWPPGGGRSPVCVSDGGAVGSTTSSSFPLRSRGMAPPLLLLPRRCSPDVAPSVEA